MSNLFVQFRHAIPSIFRVRSSYCADRVLNGPSDSHWILNASNKKYELDRNRVFSYFTVDKIKKCVQRNSYLFIRRISVRWTRSAFTFHTAFRLCIRPLCCRCCTHSHMHRQSLVTASQRLACTQPSDRSLQSLRSALFTTALFNVIPSLESNKTIRLQLSDVIRTIQWNFARPHLSIRSCLSVAHRKTKNPHKIVYRIFAREFSSLIVLCAWIGRFNSLSCGCISFLNAHVPLGSHRLRVFQAGRLKSIRIFGL